MTLDDLINKTCLIGLSYFDLDGALLKQSQLCGTVTSADQEEGISIQLQGKKTVETEKAPVFILPPTLSAWFTAPPGNYKNPESGIDIKDPDYLVTWDIYKTKKDTPEGEHEWWEWVPRTAPPQVGS